MESRRFFHSSKLRLAATDTLPTQVSTDTQPEPQLVRDDMESEVEQMLRDVLVKWEGSREVIFDRVIYV